MQPKKLREKNCFFSTTLSSLFSHWVKGVFEFGFYVEFTALTLPCLLPDSPFSMDVGHQYQEIQLRCSHLVTSYLNILFCAWSICDLISAWFVYFFIKTYLILHDPYVFNLHNFSTLFLYPYLGNLIGYDNADKLFKSGQCIMISTKFNR